MSKQVVLPTAPIRTFVSLVAPLFVAWVLASTVIRWFGGRTDALAGLALLLGCLGLISWLVGQYWYGLPALGLRGRRPLFASTGFAVLGWLGVLALRVWFIESAEQTAVGISGDFVYLLLFEAFAIQLWVYGLFFRGVADWRGPLTAAISSGLLFGTVASLFFLESTYGLSGNLTAYLYFLSWGIFYGLIRLRTGSLLGTVAIQALQSLTAWHILLPQIPPSEPASWGYFYTGMGIVYMILAWRLWPNEESDYRV